jgi:O-antigen/teichoic acid export membrane protein
VTGVSRKEESVAAQGARWITAAFVIVGALNYSYSLILTRLLDVSAYASFAAGQGLILWASSVATVSVPWALAQGLARARSNAERDAALRFSIMASIGSGVLVAAIVGAIATRFGNSFTVLAVALSTLLIFMGTTTTGWFQGHQRMRRLSALYVGENVLKNLAGVLLVSVAGLGENGALTGFAIGAVVMLAWRPRLSHNLSRPWRAALANRDLWRRTLRVAGAQAIVSLFVAADVVLVAVLPGSRALVASYQASSALSRSSLFVAGAVATAFFPLLSRHADGATIAARAVKMYTAVALPLAAVLATTPPVLLTKMFPAQYAAMATLLKYTAAVSLATGGISLLTAFFQAADDYSSIRWLAPGLAGYVVALLVGWRIHGIVGIAVGAAAGTMGALLLLAYRLLRREGFAPFRAVPLTLLETLAAAAVLFLLRPHLDLWLAAAALAGLRAVGRFLRPGARHKRSALWPAAKRPAIASPNATGRSPVSLLTGVAWQGNASDASSEELSDALALAHLNRVEGCLARAYPHQLVHVLADLRAADDLFTRYLHQATDRLRRARIPAVLIEDLRGDHICTSIDLVVGEQDWHKALDVLAGWSQYNIVDSRERSAKSVYYPAAGPSLTLYTGFAPYGVRALPADRLLARAFPDRHGILIPAAADFLRLRLACALFDDQALDLAVLRTLRRLRRAEVLTAARAEARREGWGTGFDLALATAGGAMERLDRGGMLDIPVPVRAPVPPAEHAGRRRGPGRTQSPDRGTALGPALSPSRKSGVMIP